MTSNEPVTEVTTLYLAPGTNLEDTRSPAYKICSEAIEIIASQPGFQHAYYGHHVEDRSKADLVVGEHPCHNSSLITWGRVSRRLMINKQIGTTMGVTRASWP